MTDYLGYLYGLLIAGGGLAGYLVSGSVMSLVMGLLCGSLACLGDMATQANVHYTDKHREKEKIQLFIIKNIFIFFLSKNNVIPCKKYVTKC